MERTWHGRAVQIHKGSISELLKKIPEFGRYPFSVEEGIENEYLDLIARRPHLEDEGHVPVAAVSKGYNFVEHHEVIESVLLALKNFVDNPQSLKAELKLSRYGARMWIHFLLPNCKFNPGDGYPVVLQVNCLNSVDKSIAVRIHLSWYREKSDTEMIGRGEKWYHTESFKTERIEEFLAYQFRRFSKEENLYKKWYETKLDWKSVVKWLNKTVAKKWGAHAAVRAYHIAKTGYDIEVERISRITHDKKGVKIEEVKLRSDPLELEKFDFIAGHILESGFIAADELLENDRDSIKRFINDHLTPNVIQVDLFRPDSAISAPDYRRQNAGRVVESSHEFVSFATDQILKHDRARFLKIKMIREVPGLFTPVENVYHVSQVLSWLASQQETIQGQLERMGQIHGLMDALLKQEKLPLILRLGREYKRSR